MSEMSDEELKKYISNQFAILGYLVLGINAMWGVVTLVVK